MPQSKKDDFKVVRRQNAPQPSAVERQVKNIFGMEPNLQRGTLLPFAKNPKTGKPEFAAPQVLYDLARAFVAPGVVLSGQPVDLADEAQNFALNFTGTGAASRVGRLGRGALAVDRNAVGMSGGAPRRAAPKPKTEQSLAAKPKTEQSLAGVERAWTKKGIKHSITERNGTITLNKIVVPKDERGGGKGTSAMKQLLTYADNTGQRVVLTPSSDFGGNKKRLTGFYKNLGFTENKGKKRDFSVRETMVREPSSGVSPTGQGKFTVVGAEPKAEKPLAADPQGIIAYHGSPHSFDRFDISKIGTGEGAQAYGHGLYFAEAEPVAQEYRQRLAEVTAAPFDEIGIPPKEWNAATMFARQMDPSQPDVAARDFAQWVGREVTPELVDAFRVAKKPGSMYQVRLNVRPEDLLDWDAAFTPESLESFAAKFDRVNPATRQRLEDWSYVSQKRGLPMPEGSDVMQQLGEGRVSSPELSRMLNEAGILGVQYLDQASRSVGDGTRNYVMFNDDLIDLLRKYAKGGSV